MIDLFDEVAEKFFPIAPSEDALLAITKFESLPLELQLKIEIENLKKEKRDFRRTKQKKSTRFQSFVSTFVFLLLLIVGANVFMVTFPLHLGLILAVRILF